MLIPVDCGPDRYEEVAMIPVGVFNGYFPYGLKESIAKVKAAGFSVVQLDVSFKDIDMTAGNITKEKCRTIT